MPDSPDYSKYLLGSSHFSLQDMGELAVRLGSIDTFDRRGDVIYIDDFRHGVTNWQASLPGTAAKMELSVRSSFQSPYCIRLLNSLETTRVLSMSRVLALNLNGNLGIEICFKGTAYFDTFYSQFIVGTTAKVITTKIRLNTLTKQVEAYDSSAGFTYANIDLPATYPITTLHFMKYVFSPSTGKYIRLMYDDIEVDISDIAYKVAAGGSSPTSIIGVEMLGNSVVASDIDMLHYIITSNEP